PSAAVKLASSLYIAFRPVPVALGTGDALLAAVTTSPVVVATSEPTYYLQGPSQALL
ncbi:hypothetical protein A2U01_0104660, partial [Trifolium medium]|nr:hypothetical protein [Trifolium medium]